MVDALTERVAGGELRRRSFDEIANEMHAPALIDGESLQEFDQSFVSGPSNPVSTPGTFRRVDDAIELRTTVPVRYGGMPASPTEASWLPSSTT